MMAEGVDHPLVKLGLEGDLALSHRNM